MPDLEQRPAPSLLEQKNLINRAQDDQGSIASFLKHVQGEDSLMEVIVGRGKLITLQAPLAYKDNTRIPVVALGDPTVLDFDFLPSSQMIRILGKRIGVTDLSVVTTDGKADTFEVRVVYDMMLLRAYIKQLFPSASLQLVQMYEHVVVEGEAASTDQSHQIITAINAFLTSAQVARTVESATSTSPDNAGADPKTEPDFGEGGEGDPSDDSPSPFQGGADDKPDATATLPPPQIINLIRVPGVQQIMLQVKIAEVNRSALRKMGTSLLVRDNERSAIGSLFGSSSSSDLLGGAVGAATTAFAIISGNDGSFSAAFDALRANQVVNVLAEPNLMAMHGQKASFLAGGEFPVPVPQGTGQGTTIEFKEFGVLLEFIPYIMDNGNIRLKVAPEVSTIDQTIGVISEGLAVPGVNTRRVNTTVELRPGQTLAIGGLLQVELEAGTNRLPGLGDLPYIGPFFSNNSHSKVEKELIILVTPSFIEPIESHQVGPLPGCEIRDPDDFEFYALNRIESRHPTNNYRATNGWDDPMQIRDKKNNRSKKKGLFGVFGFSK